MGWEAEINPDHLIGYINEPREGNHANAQWEERPVPLLVDENRSYIIRNETCDANFVGGCANSKILIESNGNLFPDVVKYKEESPGQLGYLEITIQKAVTRRTADKSAGLHVLEFAGTNEALPIQNLVL